MGGIDLPENLSAESEDCVASAPSLAQEYTVVTRCTGEAGGQPRMKTLHIEPESP